MWLLEINVGFETFEALISQAVSIGVFIGFIVALLAIGFMYFFIVYVDRLKFRNYLYNVDVDKRKKILADFEVLAEKIECLCNDTNLQLFKKWHNFVLSIKNILNRRIL